MNGFGWKNRKSRAAVDEAGQEFKLLLPYVKREAGLYIAGFAGSVFRFLIPLSVPLLIKYLFDHLLQNDELTRADKLEQLLWISALTLLAFVLVRTPMEYVRQYCLHKANHNVIKRLRKDAFRKIHALDAGYLADRKSGQIGTRFFDDIEKVRGYMTAMFSNIWIELIVLGFVVIVMASIHAPLTLLAVGMVGTQFAVAHALSKRFKASTREMMGYRSTLNGFLLEKIQGALITKLFGAERQDRRVLDAHLDAYEQLTTKHSKLNAVTLATVNAMSDVTPFAIAAVGSLLVIDGGMTLGGLIAFYAYVDKMRSPVSALVQAFPTVTEGSVAISRIFAFLHLESDIREPEQPVVLERFQDSIKFRQVTFGYPNHPAIFRELSFTLKKGRTYAFVGESGGGKSTILQLMLRLYDAEQGAVLIDGTNIKQYALSSLREHIGIVTQDNFLYGCSIRDNIRMAKPEATDEEVIEAARKAHAHAFIAKLANGYDAEIGERGVKLSGGQKQRIALARVFLKNPSIILLDEATSALDNESEQLVQQSIRRIGRDHTVVMIAHRLSTVVHADSIFVIQGGRIVECGSHSQLLAMNGKYAELYAKQNPNELVSGRTG